MMNFRLQGTTIKPARRIADRYKKCDVAKYRWYDIYRNGLSPERWPMRYTANGHNLFNFLMLPPPAGVGWGGGSKVKIMPVGSIIEKR